MKNHQTTFNYSTLAAALLILISSYSRAQSVIGEGNLATFTNSGCYDVQPVPSNCQSQITSPIGPVNTPIWNLSTAANTGLHIGTNLSNSNNGNPASGSVKVLNGGVVNSAYVYLGNEANTTGSINISGPNSKWINNSSTVVGNSGSGSLTITNGGELIQPNSDHFYIGNGVGSRGTVLIQGVSSAGQPSTLSTHNRIYIGYQGYGELHIKDGGLVSSGFSPMIGVQSGGRGIVYVEGINDSTGIRSTFTSKNNNIQIGGFGYGEVNVLDGALLSPPTLLTVGTELGGSGVLNVDGFNKKTGIQSTASSGAIVIGYEGNGVLNITNGAIVNAKSSGFNTSAGRGPGAIGIINIDGENSSFNANIARIGDNGQGVLNIYNHGSFNAESIVLANKENSTGTLNIGKGSAAGILNSPKILSGQGLATINFNHNESIKFSSDMSGNINVNHQGLGSTTFLGESLYTGTTSIQSGIFAAGSENRFSPNSNYVVYSPGVLSLNGFSQKIGDLTNNGLVSISQSTSNTPSTTLEVTGNYVGNNGTIGISTMLENDASSSDKLLLSGGNSQASGSTFIKVTNAGGLGAQTTSAGIPVVETANGASLQANSFFLYGEHVDAGAYEYRLVQTDKGAALFSTIHETIPPTPVTPHVTAYRGDVPLISALPEQLRQSDISMLGNLNKRVGDDLFSNNSDLKNRAWGRIIHTSPKINQTGTVSPSSKGHLNGFQTGIDFYSNQNIRAGVYIGQLEGTIDVSGFSGGISSKEVGFNQLRNRYFGIYGTWQDMSGSYIDAVLQGSRYHTESRLRETGNSFTSKGNSTIASLEIGKPFALKENWYLEPQAQIIYRNTSLDDFRIDQNTKINSNNKDNWMLRLGARLKGSFSTSLGTLQPYGRINFYKVSNYTDSSAFIAPAATTQIYTQGGGTSTELEVGASLKVSSNVNLYSSIGKIWANSGNSKVSSNIQAQIGINIRW